MGFCEAGLVVNTAVFAMFGAVVLRAGNRYRRKVTATSKAWRRALDANAVLDGGGAEERGSAALWAYHGYSHVSMSDHVE